MARSGHDQVAPSPGRGLRLGVVAGMVAAAAMAMYAMGAAATYQGTGFFTPLYHIAASLIGDEPMKTSMEHATRGQDFHFALGSAVVGMGLHLATGAGWGALFGLVAGAARLRGITELLAGVVYGLAIMVVMGFLVLPVVADVLGGGKPIEDMPAMVGWGTFAVEHALFGLVLGLWPFARTVTSPRRSLEPVAA